MTNSCNHFKLSYDLRKKAMEALDEGESIADVSGALTVLLVIICFPTGDKLS
jgi:hypothetical protein